MKAFIVLPLDKIERGKGDSTYRGEGKRAAESISTILVRVSSSLPLIGHFNPSSHNFRDPFFSHRIDFTGFHSTFRRNACRPTLQLCNYWDNLVDTLIFVSYEGIRWRSGGRYSSSTVFRHLFFSFNTISMFKRVEGEFLYFLQNFFVYFDHWNFSAWQQT